MEENQNEENKVKTNELGLHTIEKSFSRKIDASITELHEGSLRSGNRIEYEGSLVIIGDVNAGAEVIAEENVVVLGTIRGLVHAGAKGNKDAIIVANSIEAPQIRIADIVKEIERIENLEENEEIAIKKKAYVENDKIVLE